MTRVEPDDNLDLLVARHFAQAPAAASSFDWLRAWFGRERFGFPVAPWGTLATPVPVGAGLLLAVRLFALPAHTWPWLADRLGEIAWVCLMPFVLATLGQAVAMAYSDHAWRESEGERHVDYSPRTWHYAVAVAIAAAPLFALQLSNRCLNAYLKLSWLAQSFVAPNRPVHVGYDPDLANLMVLGVLPLVFWQVHRLMRRIPCGRLLGFQRELGRLKGAVAWDAKAWTETVGAVFERWTADLLPADTGSERARQHRLRWLNLYREVVAAYQQQPADLARANRALATYRQGL